MDLPISITLELIALGGFASNWTEFLRGLILRIEDWPRLKNNWRFVPSFWGIIGILLYPNASPGLSMPLLLAHGAASPLLWILAFPYIKKLAIARTQGLFTGEEPVKAEQLPSKEEPK